MKKNISRKFLSVIIALAMIIIPSIKTNTVYAEDKDGTSGKLQIDYKNLADKLDIEFGENNWNLIIKNQEETIEINSSTKNMQFDSPYGDTVYVEIVAVADTINGSGIIKQANSEISFTVEDNKFNFTIIDDKSPTAHFKDLDLTFSYNVSLVLDKSGEWIDENENGYADVEEVINYTFNIENDGDVPLTNVTLIDEKLGINEVISQSLASSGTATYTASYIIKQDDIDAGEVENIAYVSGKYKTQTAKDSDDCTVELIKFVPADEPKISIVKTGTFNDENKNDYADNGETINYEFLVTNTGNVDLTQVSVEDKLVTVSGGSDTLAIGQNTIFTATYTITEDDINAGEVLNEATAYGTADNQPIHASDDCTVELIKFVPSDDPQISIVKTGTFVDENDNGYADAGETINYEFLVTNTGNVDLTSVAVADKLGIAVTGSTTVLAIGQNTTFTATYTITEDDINAGEVLNEATAYGTAGEQTVNASDDCTVELIKFVPSDNPKITIEKTGTFNDENNNEYADTGETINYVFKVTNTGNITLTNITISDPMETVEGGPIVKLEPGEEDSTTYTATHVITDDDLKNKKVYNEATVKGFYSETEFVEDTDSDTVYLEIKGIEEDKDKKDKKDKKDEPSITIDDSQTPAGGPIVEPEVPEETEEPEVIEELEKIEEPEVPQGTLPDTGSVLNTTLLAAIGLLLIIAGMFINKFKLIRG